MRWLGVALLIAVGVAVFAARTVKLPRSAEPAVPEATPAAVVATMYQDKTSAPRRTSATNASAGSRSLNHCCHVAGAVSAGHPSAPRPLTRSAASAAVTANVDATRLTGLRAFLTSAPPGGLRRGPR